MRITHRDVIEYLAIPLLSAGVWILWQMNDNINKLNVQVGIVISERAGDSEAIKDLKIRVRDLELKRHSREDACILNRPKSQIKI